MREDLIARKIAEKLAFNFLEIRPGDLASIYVHGTQEKIRAALEDAAATRRPCFSLMNWMLSLRNGKQRATTTPAR
jgi:hypothetical protein